MQRRSVRFSSVRELLELMQDDPVALMDLAYSAGIRHRVDGADVRDFVVRTLEPPLRAGLIRPLHYDLDFWFESTESGDRAYRNLLRGDA